MGLCTFRVISESLFGPCLSLWKKIVVREDLNSKYIDAFKVCLTVQVIFAWRIETIDLNGYRFPDVHIDKYGRNFQKFGATFYLLCATLL